MRIFKELMMECSLMRTLLTFLDSWRLPLLIQIDLLVSWKKAISVRMMPGQTILKDQTDRDNSNPILPSASKSNH